MNSTKEGKIEIEYLECVLVALELAEFPDDAIELVFADSVAFFLPFANGNHGATLGESEAHESSPERVSTAASTGAAGAAFYCRVLDRRHEGFPGKSAGGRSQRCPQGAEHRGFVVTNF